MARIYVDNYYRKRQEGLERSWGLKYVGCSWDRAYNLPDYDSRNKDEAWFNDYKQKLERAIEKQEQNVNKREEIMTKLRKKRFFRDEEDIRLLEIRLREEKSGLKEMRGRLGRVELDMEHLLAQIEKTRQEEDAELEKQAIIQKLLQGKISNKEHEYVLKVLKGGKEWKMWVINYGISLNLRGADISYLNFALGTELGNANLQDANLSKANLWQANCSDANLTGANLSFTYLRGANFRGAILKGAELSGATLYGTNFSGADLQGASLQGAQFSEDANHNCARFPDANLQGANLSNTDLSEVNFSNANMKGANLRRAKLNRSNFKGANLGEVDLMETNIFDALTLYKVEGLNKDMENRLRSRYPGLFEEHRW